MSSPGTLNVPAGEDEGNISEVEEKHNSLFPGDQSLSVLLYLPHKNRKKMRRNRLFEAGWLTNLPRLQGARPDHVRAES